MWTTCELSHLCSQHPAWNTEIYKNPKASCVPSSHPPPKANTYPVYEQHGLVLSLVLHMNGILICVLFGVWFRLHNMSVRSVLFIIPVCWFSFLNNLRTSEFIYSIVGGEQMYYFQCLALINRAAIDVFVHTQEHISIRNIPEHGIAGQCWASADTGK